ncbi:hypothetical protein BYT27DRAFT_6665363 [Phlegmacium glaucopus]|nr:hypothetical protein BYT27DRAFT_6665363 [Phlegmacium glaucopus]
MATPSALPIIAIAVVMLCLFPLPQLNAQVRHYCCSPSRLHDDSLTSEDETLHRHDRRSACMDAPTMFCKVEDWAGSRRADSMRKNNLKS